VKGHLLVEIEDVEVVEVIDLQRGVSCGSETWGLASLVVVGIITITITITTTTTTTTTITTTTTTNCMLPHNQYRKNPRKARVSSCDEPCDVHFAVEGRTCTAPADVQDCNGRLISALRMIN
jgi:hypothetical protein